MQMHCQRLGKSFGTAPGAGGMTEPAKEMSQPSNAIWEETSSVS
jgi:hypothetical protein